MNLIKNLKGFFLNAERIFALCLGLFSFLIISFPKLVAPALLIIALSILYLYIQKKITWKMYPTHLLFILLYSAYIIGIYFAFQISDGLKYAEYKLVFLIIPLLFSFKPLFKINITPAVAGLLLGVLLNTVKGAIASYTCVVAGGETMNCWTSSWFSYIHHPSYFSSFIIIAIGGIWLVFYKKRKYFKSLLLLLTTIICLCSYMLCFSLAGLLFLFLVIGVLVMYYLVKKFNVLIAFTIGVATLLVSSYLLFQTPKFQVEFQEMKTSNQAYFSDTDEFLYSKGNGAYIMGNEIRLIMWTLSSQLIIEHPFGVGTGNVDYYMAQKLKKYKMDHVIEHKYNPHNQFLQTTLEIGVLGLFLYLGILISALVIAYRNKSFFLILIVSALVFHSLFESMLQRQSGVVFYTFWIVLMVTSLTSEYKSLEDSDSIQEI